VPGAEIPARVFTGICLILLIMRLDSHLPATLRAVFSIVLFWPWLLAPSPATARETSIPEVNVAVTGNLGDLARHVEFLEDAQGQFDIDAVMTQPSERWQRTGEFNLQLGFSTSAWWVRVRFGNSGEVPVRRILEVDWPLLNVLDVTVLSAGQPVQSYQVGDQRPFAQRPIPARTFLFPLEVPPHSEQTVVMRLAMHHGIFNAVPLRLWDDAGLINAVQTENGILGLYFGAIVSLLGYNLLLFASTRNPGFLFYGLYLAMLGLWYAGFRGWGYQYLWPDNGWVNQQMNLAMPALVHLMATVFVTRFLGTRHRAPQMGRWLWLLTGLLGLPVGMALADQWGFEVPIAHGFAMYTLLSTLIILLYWVTGFVVMRRGYRPARYYVLAWSFFLAGILLYRATEFPGIGITPNLLTENSMNIGSTLEFMFLALALGDHYSHLREDKLAAEREARTLQREYTLRLETQVESRTRDLQSAMNHLKEALDSERRLQLEQREFLDTVSHELRTPLNVIDVIAQNLQLDDQDAGQQTRDRHAKLLKASDRLSSLLDTYLDEARFSLWHEGPRLKPCDLGGLLVDAAVAGEILSTSHVLVVNREHLAETGWCDPNLVRLILRTLVDNALKYTHPGTRIELRGGRDGEDIWLEVADQGAGLVPDERERVFEPRFRGIAATGQSGTGMGLSLARRMAEIQGGRLTVDCPAEGGCVFRLWLPRSAPSDRGI